eukprot:5755157-Pleurochrysis_carterae.AAC.1
MHTHALKHPHWPRPDFELDSMHATLPFKAVLAPSFVARTLPTFAFRQSRVRVSSIVHPRFVNDSAPFVTDGLRHAPRSNAQAS